MSEPDTPPRPQLPRSDQLGGAVIVPARASRAAPERLDDRGGGLAVAEEEGVLAVEVEQETTLAVGPVHELVDDLAARRDALAALGTGNGRATLFNVHLSSRRAARPVSFPDQTEGLPDSYAQLLFDKASYLTPFMRTVAWENGLPLTDAAKAFVLNADPTLLVLALEIGTRPGKLW